MAKEPQVPLRGEAAWKAERKRISDRNEAAYARGREERAARNVQHAKDHIANERREDANLPRQPRGT